MCTELQESECHNMITIENKQGKLKMEVRKVGQEADQNAQE